MRHRLTCNRQGGASRFSLFGLLKFKKRPALVIGLADFENLIICQITSQKFPSRSAISLRDKDFVSGSLQLDSFIRPDKIYTIEPHLVKETVGKISNQKLSEIKAALAKIFEISKTS